jgi:DNA-directed RNA polymerase subunit RPC12/RpoP
MAVAIACDNCGKRYSVNESVLGKRVACKQCSQRFIAKLAEANPTPAPVAKPVSKTAAVAQRAGEPSPVAPKPVASRPVAPKPVAKPARPEVIPIAGEADDWSALEAATSGAEVFDAPAATIAVNPGVSVGEHAASVAAFFGRFSAGTITRMAALVLALLFVLGTLVSYSAHTVGIAFFFLGSFVYFFVGLLVLIVRGLRSDGVGSISPGMVISLLLSVILSVLARRPVVLVRGARSGGIPGGKILGLFGNAVFIFLMIFVVGMVPMIFGDHLAKPAPFAFTPPHPFPTAGPFFPSMVPHPRPGPLSQRFSPDRITKVKITGLTDASYQGSWLYNHILHMAESTTMQTDGMAGPSNYSVELVTDLALDDLAGRIDFGTTTVDVPTRTITVATDTAQLDALLAADPNYHPRNEKPKLPATAADTPSATPTAPNAPGQPIPDHNMQAKKTMPDHAEVGMKVLVHWGASWWPATIVRLEGDKYRIHYDGWNAGSDESVGEDRIQPGN